MATSRTGIVARRLRQLFVGGTLIGLTDAQLLDRFVQRDEASEWAFEALVERHGPMVLSVCRRVLHDRHAAEDAFQATFLVLAQRARSLSGRESIGPWMREVARRAALKARARDARRRNRERKVAPAAIPTDSAIEPDDVGPILREEIDRLPFKHRVPVDLCYFEGLTHDQAAARLGWPVGTVRGRLARAREQLATRLVRRGVSLGGLLGVELWTAKARAAVPSALRDATIKAVARNGAIAAEVVELSELVSKSLFFLKLKIVAAGACSLMIAGAGLAMWSPSRAKPLVVASTNTIDPRPLLPIDHPDESLPKRALARLGSDAFREGGVLDQALYARGGTLVITRCWNHRVRVWDAASGRVVREMGEPKTNFQEIAVDDGGETLATLEYPGVIRLWDVVSGRELYFTRP